MPVDIEPGEETASQTLLLTLALKRMLRDQAPVEGRSQSEIARQNIEAYLRRYTNMCHTELNESAESLTHVPCPAKPVSTAYQTARVNVFINPVHRHQLDALAAEWGVPLVEAFRRVLDRGLRGIMQSDTG